ncbi:hypothetical protein ACXHMN_11120 [Rhizobium sp. LEGMi12c]
MTEDEERESNPRYLKERIDSLEWLIGILIGTLSDHQKGYVEYRLAEYSRNTQDQALRRDTDPARDVAAIIYDLRNNIANSVEDSTVAFALHMEH